MLIVDLKGGLGNQIFQLAAGILIARGEKLLLNTSFYIQDARHGGAIIHHIFPGLEKQYANLQTPHHNYPLLYLDRRPSHYDSQLLSLSLPLHLSGYFQNHNYLTHVLSMLQSTYIKNTSSVNLGSYGHYITDPSVHVIGLHIRRGDYISLASQFGCIKCECLFKCALEIMQEPLPDGHRYSVLIFSDEQPGGLRVPSLPCEYKHVNFKTDNKVLQDLLQFILLSKCDSIVCSNSTYSYWAGCFARRPDRVYLPSQWFINKWVTTKDLALPGMSTYECVFD